MCCFICLDLNVISTSMVGVEINAAFLKRMFTPSAWKITYFEKLFKLLKLDGSNLEKVFIVLLLSSLKFTHKSFHCSSTLHWKLLPINIYWVQVEVLNQDKYQIYLGAIWRRKSSSDENFFKPSVFHSSHCIHWSLQPRDNNHHPLSCESLLVIGNNWHVQIIWCTVKVNRQNVVFYLGQVLSGC